MKYVLDVHSHTIASGHAYNTIKEMALSAREKGLELLGITEHGPRMPGTCHEFYFHNLKVIDRFAYGIELLIGAELNILDSYGRVDLNNEKLKQMDITIASLHSPCIPYDTMEKNTSAVINAIKNPLINIIGHPDDDRYPLDYKAVVLAAKEHRTLLELNNSSLIPGGARANPFQHDREMLTLCKKYAVPIVVGSDAHVDTDVGNHAEAESMLKQMDFPEELIINRSIEELKKYVNKYKHVS